MKSKGLFLLVPVLFLSAAAQAPVFDEQLYQSVLDPDLCNLQLTLLTNNSLLHRFLDPSATLPSGILEGNINDLGNYHQCLGIDVFAQSIQIQGKYCTILVPLSTDGISIDLPSIPDIDVTWPPGVTLPPRINLPVHEGPGYIDGTSGIEEPEEVRIAEEFRALKTFALGISGVNEPGSPQPRISPLVINSMRGATFGVCVPRACTATQAVDYYLGSQNYINITYQEYFCRLPNDKLFSPADIVATVLFSLLGFILIVSTSYDLCHTFVFKRDPKSANVVLRSFSLYTNTRRLLTFTTVPGALECLDGIRALSMLWVVIGHTYAFTLLGYLQNPRDTLKWLEKFSSVWIHSAPITVDTFFCLSGILAVYTTVGKITRGRFVRQVHLFYINRLLRMFPILATMVLLQASLFNHLSDGPFWVNVAAQARNCRSWWWSALLHVQNYVNPNQICLPQTWYLSVDVQLYYFCPIILIWLFGRKQFAWIALVGILILSLVSSSLYSFHNNFSAGLFNPHRMSEFQKYMKTYYINTLSRASPFFVGMIYGYLLHVCRDKRINISFISASLLWCLSFLLMAFCVFTMYPVMQQDHDSQVFDNFLNAYMRAIWACALGWLIFACVHGYGGPINWFLSLSVWKLPARLSFAVYMIHVSVIYVANGSWVSTHFFTESNNIYRFFSDVTITFIAAFILCIAIDAPFSTLQKLLLGGGGKRPLKPTSESRENIIHDEPVVTKTSL